MIDWKNHALSEQHDAGPELATPPLIARIFIGFIALLLVVSLVWITWAMFRFGPSDEADVLQSLLLNNKYQIDGFLLTSRLSDCRTGGAVKGNISAPLFDAFKTANRQEQALVNLHDLNSRMIVVDQSQSPRDWYLQELKPIVSLSAVGLYRRQALVCVEIFARREQAHFVVLDRVAAKQWRVSSEETVFDGLNDTVTR